jgi:gliding motility-associated-like protein
MDILGVDSALKFPMFTLHAGSGVFGFALAVSAFAQQEVYVNMGPYIGVLDPSTCSYTPVAEVDIGFSDIALTLNGDLYGIGSGTIYKIDLVEAAVEVAVQLPQPLDGVSLVALDNEHLLFESWDSLFVARVDGTDVHSLGYIGYEASGDLTWFNSDLYMAAGWEALIRIVLNDDRTQVLYADSIGVMASTYGEVYGVVTIPGICGDTYQMIAFDVWDVYLVDPSNASTSLLCSQAFPYGVSGAATFAETSAELVEPVPVLENVFTPNGDGWNDNFLPEVDASSKIRSFRVMNRWGQTIHAVQDRVPWEGRSFAGSVCAEGVYYYVIETYSSCGGSTSRSGHVTLLR